MKSSSTSTAGADHHLSTTVATTNNRSLTTPAQPPRPSTTTIPQPPYPSHQQQSHFTTTTTTTRISNPNNPSLTPQKQPPPPQPPQGILYPIVSSSGRGGFVTNRPHRPQLTDQTVTVANSGGAFPPRSLIAFHQQVAQPFGFSSSDSSNHHHVHMMRPPFVQQQQHPNFSVPNGAVLLPIKGVPVSPHHKVSSSPSTISDYNGYKEMRDRSRDDACITIRDRKVKISDGTSLYALCRSWLRNGYYEESQPKNGEGTRSLPRPLPIPMADSQLPKKRQVEEERDEEDVQQLSAQEILQRHVKRAKRVRARLREERLQRIARYKARLATLLPQQEQFTDDTTAAN